jgi:Tfp pilus assembly protein PilW
MTLVEIMIVLGILATVITIVTSMLMTSSRVESRTVRRARVQGDCRQTVSLMSIELRQTGADPHNPPIGLVGLVAADDKSIHVRADLNADGLIATAEPSEDVTYAYDSAAAVVRRDPGTGAAVVLTNVTGMVLSYFDSDNQPVVPVPLSTADAARVHSIGLAITAEDRDSQPITLTTRITLRNQ